MSKFAVISGIGGAGVVGGVALVIATGVVDLGGPPEVEAPTQAVVAVPEADDVPLAAPEDRGASPEPASQDALTGPAAQGALTKPEPDVQRAVTESVPEPAPVMSRPRFDLVRAERGGPVLVAGRAEPGGRIEILVDGAAEANAAAGADGKFVAFVDIPLPEPRVLTLRATLGDQVMDSEEEILLTPPALPPAVAQIAPPDETRGRASQEPLSASSAPLAEPEPALDEAPQIALLEAAPPADAALPRGPSSPVPSRSAPAQTAPAALQARPTPEVARENPPKVTVAPEPVQDAPAPVTAQDSVPVISTDTGSAPEARLPLATLVSPPKAAPDLSAAAAEPLRRDENSGAGTVGAPRVQAQTSVPPAAEPPPRATAAAQPMPAETETETEAVAVVESPELTAPQPAAPAVIRSSASGVDVLPSAPLPPGGVALDSISYNSEGAVRLAGRGSEQGYVRVYLDNAPLTVAQVEASGQWRVTLPEVDTGTYTLRVDQIDAGGAVTSRIESPFLRESPEVLAQVGDGLSGPIASVTVQPGNTLWAIARERYGEGVAYVKVFEANRGRIRDPDLIYPGQIFDLPTE